MTNSATAMTANAIVTAMTSTDASSHRGPRPATTDLALTDSPTCRPDDVDVPPVGAPRARCADGSGTLSHLFFSEDDYDVARAKAICRPCGRQAECLAGAIERSEPYGVWGGMLLVEGAPVEFKRKRGRPPKRPVPLLVVDEAPIPPHLVA